MIVATARQHVCARYKTSYLEVAARSHAHEIDPHEIAQPTIDVPTCVRWALHEPIVPFEWTDHLHETFTDLGVELFRNVGHIAHLESPDQAAHQIGAFFASHS